LTIIITLTTIRE